MLQIVIFDEDVTVIFKDLTIETLNRVSKFIKKNRILVRFTAFALISVIALVVSIVSCGITIGLNVEYSGKNIAVVSDKSVFDSAKKTVLSSIESEDSESVIEEPEFSFTLTTKSKLCCENNLTKAIIENTDEISYSSALTVNGKIVAYGNREELQKIVDSALSKYYVEGAKNTSAFVDDVELTNGYCLKQDIKATADIEKMVGDLKVKTISTITSESDIKYSVKTIHTSKQIRGYEKVQTKGQKGVKSEIAVVETVNGKETNKTVVSRKIVKDPVQEVVVKGTGTPIVSATSKSEAKSAGFIRPMNRGDVKLVTAYWGDGRGHKGIDLAGDTGSPIFAAKAGTVTSAGWDGNYGYSVVIDHGNGYKTRYAHASALCVKAGQTVTQGQQVAKLGNTGRSTGPHLHFEILKNGNQINPAPYIGY